MNQLTKSDRSVIYALRKIGKSFRFIANQLGRPTSTISREFHRNLRPKHGYDPVDAQIKTDARRKEKRNLYKFKNEKIKDFVIDSLKKKISPAQISGRIQLETGFSISHEAIYKFIYRDKEDGGSLWENLRHKHRKRKPRIKRTPRIKNRIGIERRPRIVELKTRFGDLEIDTMIGKNHIGAILTIVDRYSKFLWAKFIEKNTAENVNKAMKELLGNWRSKIKTITSDNGSEFTYHESIAKDLKTNYYFADPYSSWQRGLNEHTNGLLRQYYPKKTCFNSKTLEDLDKVVAEINNRPRKVLDFRTPLEVVSNLKIEDTLVKNST